MNNFTKYQTIRRFAERKGFEVKDIKVNNTPAITFETATHTIKIAHNWHKECYEIFVYAELERRVLTVMRFSQKSIVEALGSDLLVEYMELPTPPTVEPETAPEIKEEVVAPSTVDTKQ